MSVRFVKGRVEHKLFFLSFSGTPGISRQKFRDIPPKSLVSLGFEGHTGLFGPTTSRGRPPPHLKISRPKSLGSFFFPDVWGKSMGPEARANHIPSLGKRTGQDCNLRCRAAIWSNYLGQGCDLRSCVAKTLRFCLCVRARIWKATKPMHGWVWSR